jgi:4-hydroxybenzoate polyprenyltransferase
MQGLRSTVAPVALFLRVEYLVFALFLPILGAASIRPGLSGPHILWLLASAFCFHVFVSLQNDIVDLKLDRTDPRRRDHPLVRGTVSVGTASLLTVLQIPLVFALSLGWGLTPLLAHSIVLVLGMLSIYNLWGKRTAFPMGTDLAQGLGFGAITLYGAASAGNPNALSWMVFWGVVVWMMQTNHLGGLRDLKSDYNYAAVTTPIFLGCTYGSAGHFISKPCRLYSYTLLSIQYAVPFLFLWKDKAVIEPPVLAALAIVLLLTLVAAALSLGKFFAIGSKSIRIEFDPALIVMYLSALPMLTVLALNGSPWVILSASVVILATVRTYLRIINVLP